MTLACDTALSQSPATKSQPPATKGEQASAKGVREEKLAAGDGWPIHATYYESASGKEADPLGLGNILNSAGEVKAANSGPNN